MKCDDCTVRGGVIGMVQPEVCAAVFCGRLLQSADGEPRRKKTCAPAQAEQPQCDSAAWNGGLLKAEGHSGLHGL